MKKCNKCGKSVSEDQLEFCECCGELFCEECGTDSICSICAELWVSEIDLDDSEFGE